MKRLVSLNYLVFFIFLLSSSTIYSQTGMGPTSPNGPIHTHLVIEDFGNSYENDDDALEQPCNSPQGITLQTRITVANLYCNTYCSFPMDGNDYPELYFQYSIDQVPLETIPIDLNDAQNQSSTQLYYIYINMEFPITCQYQTIKVELMRYNSYTEQYEPYPVDNYTSPGELFDENMLDNNLEDSGYQTPLDPRDEETPLEYPREITSSFSKELYLCCDEDAGDTPSLPRLANPEVIIQEELLKKEVTNLQAFPNPFTNQLSFQYDLAKPETVHIKIIDIKGQILYENQQQKDAGFQVEQLQAELLSNGIYYLEIQSGSSIERIKLIKT